MGATAVANVPFRFDAFEHRYTIDGVERPHITGMLEKTGWINSRWYREEHSERGQAIHQLTADYDLKAFDLATLVSPFRGYVLAHAAAMAALKPTWKFIEEPFMHPVYRYGGRPDRAGFVTRINTIIDGKSGVKPSRRRYSPELLSGPDSTSHSIQTALQALLVAACVGGLPATHYKRFALYWKASGRFTLDPHRDPRDFDEALRIIRVCC